MKAKKITIRVTKRDIQKGRHGSSSSCPVALATRRAFRNSSIKVGTLGIYRWTPSYRMFPIPSKVVEFITLFDDDQTVQPFTFDLER